MTIKVVFFTNATSYLSLPMLRSLHESENLDVTNVVLFDSLSASRGRLFSVIREYGIRKTIAKVTELIWSSVRSKFSGGSKVHFTRDYAEQSAIQTDVVTSVNSLPFIAMMRDLQPDLLVVCSFAQIIKRELISIPRIAAINFHPALLPKYRGPEPIFWALYHGEKESGVTFHLIEPGIDTGDIIFQTRTPIAADITPTQLTRQLFDLAGEHAEAAITDYCRGETTAIPQQEAQASYFSFPTTAERSQLARRKSVK